MNATQAKAAASINKKHEEENKKVKATNLQNADTALLYKAFHDKIDQAVAAGALSTVQAGITIEYSADRFPGNVVTDVVTKLREEGFSVNMTTHNAYKKTKFEISWIGG